MKTQRYERVQIGDGSSYPPAYSVGDDYLSHLCSALADGTATREQQLVARSYVEAYCALVDATTARRADVVRALRRVVWRRP